MLDPATLARLHGIGLTSTLLDQFTRLGPWRAGTALLRVSEVQRANVLLHDGATEHPARVLTTLRRHLTDAGDALAVGDWVVSQTDDFGAWWVQHRLAPDSQLARRLHDGRDKVTRTVIVANVDTALLVMGLDHDFNLRRLERYAALVRLAGVAAQVVLTKADLCADPEARLAELRRALPDLPAVALDATCETGLLPLTAALGPGLQRGRTLVLLGSSGAGKSTLTNLLLGTRHQLTGASRDGDGRGRHTTTARSLHLTPAGACIIDTPGLRTLRLDSEAGQIDAVFDDIAALARHCRFRDCEHHAEPGCAVRDAVAPERLSNFHKLEREARRDERSALERKTVVAQWKARSRAARARSAAKRG